MRTVDQKFGPSRQARLAQIAIKTINIGDFTLQTTRWKDGFHRELGVKP